MNIWLLLLTALIICSLSMVVLYFIQRATNDASVVDAGWAALLGVLAILYAIFGEAPWERKLLLVATAGVWSTRLALYLLFNRVIGKEEDGRYQRMRTYWGDQAQFKFFFFFQAQALVDVILSIPFLVVAYNPAPSPSLWDLIALCICYGSILGETIADAQLARFRAKPESAGKTCREGLWRYSRHPNYFFEWLFWWTFVFMAIGSPWVWLTLLGPALMLLFLFKLTGIPYTEMQAISKRGDDYRDYQKTTSVFIPWFPKKDQT